MHVVKDLMRNDNVIMGASGRNETRLIRGDDSVHMTLEPIYSNLGKNFINSIIESNRVELSYHLRIVEFPNQTYVHVTVVSFRARG